MTSVAARSPLTTAYVALMRANLPFPVGDGAAPTSDPAGGQRLDPLGAFAILYELDAPPVSEGWTGNEASMIEVVHQVSTMGIQRDQASMACDLAAELLLGRTATGAFVHPVTLVGHVVLNRRIRNFMPIQAEGTFQSGFQMVTALALA